MGDKFNIHEFFRAGNLFLKEILIELKTMGIEVSASQIDHLCFRVKTQQEYTFFKNQLSWEGKLLTEAEINGRAISTFRVHRPFQIDNHNINLVELPSPKINCDYDTGFEHAEFVISESIDRLASRFPKLPFTRTGVKNLNAELCLKLQSGQVKFHYQPLDRTIDIEKAAITDIIFDLDGTLIQSRDTIYEINRCLFSEILQRNIPIGEAISKFHPEFEKMFDAFGIENEALKRRAVARWSSLSDEFTFHLFEDINSLIDSLSNTSMNLHLWTARDEASAKTILRQHKIESAFKTISGSTDEHSKPDPRALKFDWKSAPKNSYALIGDSATDIIASKNINAIAIGALWCSHSNEHSLSAVGAEAYFYSVKEFSDWVSRKINAGCTEFFAR